MLTKGHEAPISGIASYEGEYVVTAGYDSKLILWDSHFGIVKQARHDHLVNHVDISPCGQYIASASSDYTVRLWKMGDLDALMRFDVHRDDVEMVKFSPNSRYLAACSRDYTITIYDLQKGCLIAHLIGHEADVLSIEWLDENNLVSCGDDSTVRYWRVDEVREVHRISFDEIETDTLVFLSEDLVAVGNDAGDICILNMGDPIQTVNAHESGVKRVTYNKANQKLVSISYDRKMALWSFEGGRLEFIEDFDLPSYVWPRSCCFLDNDQIVFGTFTSHYAIFDIRDREWRHADHSWSQSLNTLTLSGEDIYTIGDSGTLYKNGEELVSVRSLCNFVVSRNQYCYFGGQEGLIWRYDSANCELREIYQNKAPINCALLYGDSTLLVGDYNGQILKIGLNDSKVDIIKVFNHAVKSISLMDNTLFSVSADAKAAYLNLSTLTVSSLGKVHEKIANGCAASKNAFFSVSRDLKVRRFSPKLDISIQTPHKNSVKTVAVSEDGQHLATGSYSGEVAIYSCDEDEIKLSRTVRPTNWGISQLVFDPENLRFVASSYDGKTYDFCV